MLTTVLPTIFVPLIGLILPFLFASWFIVYFEKDLIS